MGYYVGIGSCGMCDETFTFNPERVPNFPLDQREAPPMSIHRFHPKAAPQPVCKLCFEAINAWRVEQGLAPHTYLHGAWGESETVG